MKFQRKTLAGTLLVLAGLAALALFVQAQLRPPARAGGLGRPIGGSLAGLVDGNKKTVDEARFAGRHMLVFFGYTRCPSVCPAGLEKMARVLAGLAPGEKARLAPVFVSVDPARDGPEEVGAYAAMFDPAIEGLTGDPPLVARIMGQWRAYAAAVPAGEGDYTIDHTTFTYLRGPDGRLEGLFASSDPPTVMLEGIRAALGR